MGNLGYIVDKYYVCPPFPSSGVTSESVSGLLYWELDSRGAQLHGHLRNALIGDTSATLYYLFSVNQCDTLELANGIGYFKYFLYAIKMENVISDLKITKLGQREPI